MADNGPADNFPSDDFPAEDRVAQALTELRQRIDDIDGELQRLLNERARWVLSVGELKRENSTSGEAVFHRPEREAQILRSVAERNGGPFPTEDMVRLFREVISSCLALEQPLTVAFLGPEGTFTEAAMVRHFGHAAIGRSAASIADVFREVETGATHYGVVPVENSTEGVINHTLDCLSRSTVRICGEVALPIHHNLLIAPGVDVRAIRRIYSHQQSFAQCRGWLDAHWAGVERIPVASNAEAARLAAGATDAAAVAGELARERYGLSLVAANIEDETSNTTRFHVLGRHEVGPSGRDKTSLLVAARNEPGALYRILEPLHRRGINLTRIEARPARTGNWSYVFFLDVDGHISDALVAAAVEDVRAMAMELRILGSYPRGDV